MCLTEKGRDLLPVSFALVRWGDKYIQDGRSGPLDLTDDTTGEPVRVEVLSKSERPVPLGSCVWSRTSPLRQRVGR